ncbi:MAG: DUF378 domain-containing protein [Patescibacteria group bacterium]|nr:DUF378 domain-containing protein [Patescibacteria group bacterium]
MTFNLLNYSNMKNLHVVTFILLIIGGLNWLLLALTGWEVGQLFGGSDTLVSKIVYILVGLAAIFEVATHKSTCRACPPGGSSM